VLADPLYWGGGVAALGLGGLLWWMMAGGRRQKTGAGLEDSLIAGGTLNPGHGGGAASGGSVNTGDSSFLTDFSQAGLGAIDTHDVDPIAEAEVYMAYGRDAQAEEILKEAIGKTPERHEIRVKLLEIYAARRNAAAFGSAAGELYAALGGKPGPLWDKVCEMGRNVDPTNPLYGNATPVAPVFAAAATVAATAGVSGGAVTFADELVVPKSLAAKPAPVVAAAPQAVAPAPVPAPEPVFEFANEIAALDFDFGDAPKPDAKAAVQKTVPALDLNLDTEGLKFELPDLDVPSPQSAAGDFDFGQAESSSGGGYDFSGFDLDLGGSAGDDLDEVGTKLDLARAYVEMGDKEGAREILNEVLAEGNDRQKADAKGIMSSLG
jgi:pilus assembly protein FimV